MASWKYFYLIRIEFLGFRYHGWQKQAGLKSVHGMVDKTLSFVLEHDEFRSLGCGRTDAKVSANDYAFELFLNEPVVEDKFLHSFNSNLPSDIRAKRISAVGTDFNIIQQAKRKEYHYYFSSGEKSHPFNAPFIRDFGKALDVDSMKEAAKFFEGTHNFKRYVSKPSPDTVFVRQIDSVEIVLNDLIAGNFTPAESYVLKVVGAGFMRYQIRLMMGALIDVGRGVWTNEDIVKSLNNHEGQQIRNVAPSSGLVLHKVEFDE